MYVTGTMSLSDRLRPYIQMMRSMSAIYDHVNETGWVCIILLWYFFFRRFWRLFFEVPPQKIILIIKLWRYHINTMCQYHYCFVLFCVLLLVLGLLRKRNYIHGEMGCVWGGIEKWGKEVCVGMRVGHIGGCCVVQEWWCGVRLKEGETNEKKKFKGLYYFSPLCCCYYYYFLLFTHHLHHHLLVPSFLVYPNHLVTPQQI